MRSTLMAAILAGAALMMVSSKAEAGYPYPWNPTECSHLNTFDISGLEYWPCVRADLLEYNAKQGAKQIQSARNEAERQDISKLVQERMTKLHWEIRLTDECAEWLKEGETDPKDPSGLRDPFHRDPREMRFVNCWWGIGNG